MGWSRKSFALFTLVVTTSIGACSSSESAASAPSEDGGTDAPSIPDAADAPSGEGLAWKQCPGPVGRRGECVKMDMPLDWSNPTGKKIPVLVLRSLAATQPAKSVLWSLPGGPGQGATLENLAAKELADFDLYSIDFRGSGQSSPLDCQDTAKTLGWFEPQDVAKVNECGAKLKATWGDDLRHFSTTNGARDLAEAMRRTEVTGQRRFVLGISFGTLMAQRLLQVAPGLALDGVILDSILSPTRSAAAANASWDTVLGTVVEACAAKDAICRDRLGPDPKQVIADLRAKFAQPTGHCPTSRGYTPRQYRRLVAHALSLNTFAPLPAFLHRLNRCEPADEPAIQKFADRLKPFEDDAGTGVNIGLFFHVSHSELATKTEPTAEMLAAQEDASVASVHEAVALRMTKDAWPVAPPDPLDDAYASTNVPMLFLSGAFDPRTPVSEAQEVKSHFPGEKQAFVKFAGLGHNVFPGLPCPRGIVSSFLKTPTAMPDRTCADVDNTIYASAAQATTYFGTAHSWDN